MTFLEKLKVLRGYNFNRTVTMTLINLLKKKVIHENNVHKLFIGRSIDICQN